MSSSPEAKQQNNDNARAEDLEDWSLTFPSDLPESVAFEIPLEKKGINAIPSSIQMRLAGQVDSPRNVIRLEDITKKLDDASKRKKGVLEEDLTKVASHNAKAHAIFEKAKEQETEKLNALEASITSKLSNAEAKKNEITTSGVQKLLQATMDKLQRGAKAIIDDEWSAKELETKIDIKSLKADLRREEMKLENQEKLALANQDKLGRGQLVLSAAEDAAKQIDARCEQKIIAADHHREMNQIQQTARLNEYSAFKKEKAVDVIKQDEEQRRKLLVEIEEKMKRAEERKAAAMAEKTDVIAAQTNDKLRRGAEVGKALNEKAKAMSEQLTTKVELANQRREDLIRDQQEILKDFALKKERLVVERQKKEEKISEEMSKKIQSKLLSATERKEDMTASKVESIKTGYDTKQARAQETLLLSLAEAKELQRTSEKRLAKASKKKNAILKAMVDERMDENKSKIDKVEAMNRIKELDEIQRLIDIEKKLFEANEKRDAALMEKMPTKKLLLPSPRLTNTSNIEEIEARIELANQRREGYLAERVENATKKRKSSRPTKQLFVAASPASSSTDSDISVLPDLLEGNAEYSAEEYGHCLRGRILHLVGLADAGGSLNNMYLIAIGGIAAAAFVGLMLLRKQ